MRPLLLTAACVVVFGFALFLQAKPEKESETIKIRLRLLDERSGWFAVRIESVARNELNAQLYAHSSPVYVDLAGGSAPPKPATRCWRFISRRRRRSWNASIDASRLCALRGI